MNPTTNASAENTSTIASDHPASAGEGSPRHQFPVIPPRCRNRLRKPSGTSSPNRNQDSEMPEAAPAMAAHGDSTTSATTVKPRLASSSRRGPGGGVPAGQAARTSAAPRTVRTATAARSSPANISHESW
ncbi:hypothetical protein [Prauserella shujinwangii]|uniref:hypothetical protein n=1 Tax=Prauserella shujinwangii TaxID=1453103 RepID=UPI000D081AD7|nr:hypothetical protein [Prauserella shujinwangii]